MNHSNNPVWHPFTQMETALDPLQLIKAKGTWLFAEDGKKYLDANSSWWVNVHGHGNEYIGEAISNQFKELDHTIFAGATHPKAQELARRITEILPTHFTKVFFSDDGSTAVEVALKMMFQFYHNQGNPKKRILAIDGAYHGDTFGAMAIGQRGYFNEPFEHFFFDVDFLEFPTEANEAKQLANAEKLFQTGEFAGLIVEPLVQGSSGMRMYSVQFLDKLVSLAKQHQVKVIFDEIMTGWGRTGKLFAMDHCTQKPDIVCLSKGLTGGVLPLGLTVATDELFNAFLAPETDPNHKTKALLHGHSFTGNALACAAACASLDIFETEDTKLKIERLSAWNSQFKEELTSLEENQINDFKYGLHEVRQSGTILAIELKTDENSSYFSSIRDEAYTYFIDNGILLRPLGNVIFINPPYCITEEEYSFLKKTILGFLKK